MLLFAADYPVLPVDARVGRVSRRLGYGRLHDGFARTARSVRTALAAELPSNVKAYQLAAVYLEHHGSATCAETDPHCHVCPLNGDCPEGQSRLAQGSRLTRA
jgi:endonuclease III